MKNLLVFIYSVLSYALFLGVFIYAIGFIGNIGIINSLDSIPSQSIYLALLINVSLLGLFAFQHTLMARSWFQQWIYKYIPKSAERATYVLFSNIAMILVFAYWEPMGGIIWHFESVVARQLIMGCYALGWIVLLLSTFLINHFHLFGLQQPWSELVYQESEPSKFITPLLYKFVRHPIYMGWLIIFWSAPTMTVAHMVFALLCTAYIFIGIYFEEIDLIEEFGEIYEEYQKETPMVLPFIKTNNDPQSLEKISN